MTLVETLQKQGRERPCCVWWTERASFPRFAPDQCCPLLCLRRTRQVCRGHSECSSGYCHPMRKQCAGKKCKANGDCRTGFCGAGKYVASVRARPVRRAAQPATNMCYSSLTAALPRHNPKLRRPAACVPRNFVNSLTRQRYCDSKPGTCTTHGQCITGFCNSITSRCDTKPTACTANANCASGWCDPSSNTCTTKPTTDCAENSQCDTGYCHQATKSCKPVPRECMRTRTAPSRATAGRPRAATAAT